MCLEEKINYGEHNDEEDERMKKMKKNLSGESRNKHRHLLQSFHSITKWRIYLSNEWISTGTVVSGYDKLI